MSDLPIDLALLRAHLIRLEETIIFSLIERAQFKCNPLIYSREGTERLFGQPLEGGLSFADYFLFRTECLHSTVRRYTDPEENQFFESLPAPILPRAPGPTILAQNSININQVIKRVYREVVVPRVAKDGDDGHYGSSVTIDVSVLQALSKRIHYGKNIAEAKWRGDPALYQRLADQGDWQAMLTSLTDEAVELKLLKRVRHKAAIFGQDVGPDGGVVIAADSAPELAGGQSFKVDPELVANLYKEIIIPLTKEVEVRYLFHRAGVPVPENYHGAGV